MSRGKSYGADEEKEGGEEADNDSVVSVTAHVTTETHTRMLIWSFWD